MNIKWMSLVAVVTVVSVGCSDSEQESSGNSGAVMSTSIEVVEEVKSPATTGQVKTEEQKATLKEELSSTEGISLEKLDSEVKSLVAKISETSDMSEEEAAKLERDLKSIFQKVEAERQAQ